MIKNKAVTLSIFLLLVLFTSCTLIMSKVPLSRQVQALYLTKGTAETIKDTAIALHKAGKLSDENYNKIKKLYNKGREINNKIVDYMLANIDKDVTKEKTYIELVHEFNEVTKVLVNLSLELGLVKEEDLIMLGGGIIE